MVNPLKKKISVIDEEIDRVRSRMLENTPDSEEYDVLLSKFERLVRLQGEPQSNRISPDTKAVVCANLLGILVIVGYEQGHVIVSRGLNFLLRTKHQ